MAVDEPNNVEIYTYPSVVDRAIALGCSLPTRIAVLPRNYESAEAKDDLVHEQGAAALRVLMRRARIEETPLDPPGARFDEIVERSADQWIAPTLFISSLLMSQNPAAVSIALGVVANYATDLLRRAATPGRVRVNIVVETGPESKCRRFEYAGPVEGLDTLARAIEKATDNE